MQGQNQNSANGVAFEQFIKTHLTQQGLAVVDTPTSNDYGADLIFEYKGCRFAVQCKYYSGAVGVHAVQEVFTALSYYKAQFGIVITNSIFTQQAINLAATNRVLTVNGNTIARFINQNGTIPMLDEFMEKAKNNSFVPQNSITDNDLVMSDLEIRYGMASSRIRQLFMSAGLPFYQVGRTYHFKKDQIEQWEIQTRYIQVAPQKYLELPAFNQYRCWLQNNLNHASASCDYDKIEQILSRANREQIQLDVARAPKRPEPIPVIRDISQGGIIAIGIGIFAALIIALILIL